MIDEALASDLYMLFSRRLAEAGVGPADPDLLGFLASMIGAHYIALGGRDKVSIGKILTAVTDACRVADEALDAQLSQSR